MGNGTIPIGLETYITVKFKKLGSQCSQSKLEDTGSNKQKQTPTAPVNRASPYGRFAQNGKGIGKPQNSGSPLHCASSTPTSQASPDGRPAPNGKGIGKPLSVISSLFR